MNTLLALQNLAYTAPMWDPSPLKPPGFDKVQTVIQYVAWVVVALAFVGLLFIAGRLFINNRRGEGTEEVMNLGWIALGLIIVAGAGSIIGAFVTWS